MKHLGWIFALALLASCGSSDSADTAGGVTPGEAEALNDAAEMLDESSQPKFNGES